MDQSALDELRKSIDRIDADIVTLLNRRYQAVTAVGEYKKEHHLPVFDPEREQRLLARLDELNTGPMTPETLHTLYREIMAGARALERAEPAAKKEVLYLDNAAAAPVLPEISASMREVWEANFANPEAAHTLASSERKKIQAAAAELQNAILPGRLDDEAVVSWGSGASELIAAIGLSLGDNHKQVWGSFLDHPAAQAMQSRAFGGVHRMKIDRFARLEPLIDDGEPAPALGFFTWVQSEVGTVLNLERLTEFRTLFPDAVVVLDAVQGAGKLAYPGDAPLPDVLILSGHKFGAPGGGALLFPTKRGRKLAGRFSALREPDYQVNRIEPASAILLARAAKAAAERQAEEFPRMSALTQKFRDALGDKVLPNGKKLRLTLPAKESSPYIVHCTLPGYQSGVLVRMLAEKGIMVSAGSACQSETDQPSAVLTAMGMKKDLVWSGLRISPSGANTDADVNRFADTLAELLENY